ncbi:MAG: hypothetical protein JO051_14085 [Acidobacteriaceae bacterium]|nr:hypothetical protein [Acidobacteriaceae bacterium]
MSRNVDVVAVTLLLAGVALVAQARHVITFGVDARRIAWTTCPRMVIVPPRVPSPPPLPRIKVMRD